MQTTHSSVAEATLEQHMMTITSAVVRSIAAPFELIAMYEHPRVHKFVAKRGGQADRPRAPFPRDRALSRWGAVDGEACELEPRVRLPHHQGSSTSVGARFQIETFGALTSGSN